jgi:hypothetical protein
MAEQVAVVTAPATIASRYTPASLRRPLLLGAFFGIVLSLPLITV